MNADQARERVAGLAKYIDDPEVGHAELDDLLEDILKAIAEARDGDECQELAAIGLEAIAAVPVRWCA